MSSICHQHLCQKLRGLALAPRFCASLGPQACPSLQQSQPPMTTDLPPTMRATSWKMRGLQMGGHSSQSGTTRLGGRDTGGGRDRQGPESDRIESASWRRDWEHYSLSGDLTGRQNGPRAHCRPGSKQFRLNSHMCPSDHYHGKATRQHVIKGLWRCPGKGSHSELAAQPQGQGLLLRATLMLSLTTWRPLSCIALPGLRWL